MNSRRGRGHEGGREGTGRIHEGVIRSEVPGEREELKGMVGYIGRHRGDEVGVKLYSTDSV